MTTISQAALTVFLFVVVFPASLWLLAQYTSTTSTLVFPILELYYILLLVAGLVYVVTWIDRNLK